MNIYFVTSIIRHYNNENISHSTDENYYSYFNSINSKEDDFIHNNFSGFYINFIMR